MCYHSIFTYNPNFGEGNLTLVIYVYKMVMGRTVKRMKTLDPVNLKLVAALAVGLLAVAVAMIVMIKGELPYKSYGWILAKALHVSIPSYTQNSLTFTVLRATGVAQRILS